MFCSSFLTTQVPTTSFNRVCATTFNTFAHGGLVPLTAIEQIGLTNYSRIMLNPLHVPPHERLGLLPPHAPGWRSQVNPHRSPVASPPSDTAIDRVALQAPVQRCRNFARSRWSPPSADRRWPARGLSRSTGVVHVVASINSHGQKQLV